MYQTCLIMIAYGLVCQGGPNAQLPQHPTSHMHITLQTLKERALSASSHHKYAHGWTAAKATPLADECAWLSVDSVEKVVDSFLPKHEQATQVVDHSLLQRFFDGNTFGVGK